jgi:hypothetical protein
MDPGAGHALIIEIGRRAKDKMGGGVPADKSGDSGGSDQDAIKESAAGDVAKALGVSDKDVDLGALASALSDFVEACMSKSSTQDGE